MDSCLNHMYLMIKNTLNDLDKYIALKLICKKDFANSSHTGFILFQKI